MFSEMSSTISIALAVIAGISLIVSAIMILTVLYMSVTETHKGDWRAQIHWCKKKGYSKHFHLRKLFDRPFERHCWNNFLTCHLCNLRCNFHCAAWLCATFTEMVLFRSGSRHQCDHKHAEWALPIWPRPQNLILWNLCEESDLLDNAKAF